ncbi:MAG: segregation/condensation protein A [Coriobacteriia bacterium]|nr:segregation/condensation protein A [Coriobacteriia bacterium]
MATYTVNTELFQGPFDLLLHLVSRQKLDVHALSMAQIVDEYIAHIEAMRELDLDVASEFLVLAAQLLEIKGAALLPQESAYDDDEFEAMTPREIRDVLVARLLAYKQFKSVSAYLEGRMIAESHQYARQAGLEPQFAALMPDFLENVTLEELATIYAELEHRCEIFLLEADHVASMPISLESYTEKVRERLRAGVSKTFAELIAHGASREEVVVTFLAVLELYKRGLVEMRQEIGARDIELTGLSEADAAQRAADIDRAAAGEERHEQ